MPYDCRDGGMNNATKSTSLINGCDTPTFASLATIPTEIFLLIASFLDPQDILALRTTCRSFLTSTEDKSLWVRLLRVQKETLPLPSNLTSQNASALMDLSLPDLESLVQSIQRTKSLWLSKRTPQGLLSLRLFHLDAAIEWDLGENRSRNLLALDVFLDRWMLLVYHEAMVELWDLFSDLGQETIHIGTRWDTRASRSQMFLCRARTALPSMGNMTSYSGVFDESQSAIFVCLTSNDSCCLLRFNLGIGQGRPGVELVHKFSTPDSVHRVKAIDLHLNLLVLSRLQTLCLINPSTHKRWSIQVGDVGEELWNGINGAKFITHEHLLCVKIRTVEFCTLLFFNDSNSQIYPNQQKPEFSRMEVDIISYSFGHSTMREVTFSDPTITHHQRPNPNGGTEKSTVISMSFLAHDLLHGLYHYRCDVHFPPSVSSSSAAAAPSTSQPSGIPLRVEFTLLAFHNMAKPFQRFTPEERSETPTPRSGFGPGTRGYVSASALGPQGKRGIWIERERNSVKRIVYGFGAGGGDEEVEEGPQVGDRPLVGKQLHLVESYDLRDDLTHCALSEVTGKVVLGTRHGDVLVI